MIPHQRKLLRPIVLPALLGLAGLWGAAAALPAQCPPPPGAYRLFLSLPPGPVAACAGSTFTVEVRGEGAAALQGFGFNVSLSGPGAIAGMAPGFAADPVFGFAGAIDAGGKGAAAFGLGDPSGPGLSHLATLTIALEAAAAPGAALELRFEGDLPLASGIVPADHLVAGGCDVAPPLLALEDASLALASCARFVRGDCSGDGEVTGSVTDAVVFYELCFLGTRASVPCLAACDANGDGQVCGSVSDAVWILAHNFMGGPPPPPPFPLCGPAAFDSDDSLGCSVSCP